MAKKKTKDPSPKEIIQEHMKKLGSKGGKVRAAKLSPERRREIGVAAAEKRWKKKGEEENSE